jgi:hypothetical protein
MNPVGPPADVKLFARSRDALQQPQSPRVSLLK